MGIKGRNGQDLDEKWKDGVITNLGMLVNGCKDGHVPARYVQGMLITNSPEHVHALWSSR